jgi:hypothetical protein
VGIELSCFDLKSYLHRLFLVIVFCNSIEIYRVSQSGFDIFGAVVLDKPDERFVDSFQALFLGQPFGRTRVVFGINGVSGIEVLCSNQKSGHGHKRRGDVKRWPILHLPSIFEKTNPSLSSERDSTFESRGNVFTCKQGKQMRTTQDVTEG